MKPFPIRMSEDMREIINDIVRYDFDREPEGGYTNLWLDQGFHKVTYEAGSHRRCFFAAYTPGGVHAIYRAFVRRMRSPAPGESKRGIRRDIQTNPHLHSKLKRQLLQQLVKAAVRYDGRGLRVTDRAFAHRIQTLKTCDQARDIQQELERHPFMPAQLRENLLHNLQTYAARLIPPG